MSIELAAQLWKETRNFIHDTNDKAEAAEAVVTVLMENFGAEEIAEEFKFDKHIKHAVAEYIDHDDLQESDDEYYDDY